MDGQRRPWLLRVLLLALGCALLALQLRLWSSDDGFPGVRRLAAEVRAQREENREMAARNQRLRAEVVDLKKGFSALEERARADLGLIAPNETFYVIDAPPEPAQDAGR